MRTLRVACHEVTLRGLVQHAERGRKSLGLPERQEIITTGTINSSAHRLQDCAYVSVIRWDALVVGCDPRGGHARGPTAIKDSTVSRRRGVARGMVCDTRGGCDGCHSGCQAIVAQVTVHNCLEDCVAWFFQGTQGQFAWESR